MTDHTSLFTIVDTPVIANPLGDLCKIHHSNSSIYSTLPFGEIYKTSIKPKCFKGWKVHKVMTLNLFPIHGHVRFAISAYCPNPLFHTVDLSSSSPCLLSIKPSTIVGFKCLSDHEAILINIASIPHSESEIIRFSPDHFPSNF